MRMIVVSARPPAASPSKPLDKGLPTARIKPATARARNKRISHCRNRAYPRDIRLAARRNIMAPQRVVW